MNFRFPSHEKMKDARSISFVFEHGSKFHSYPLLFLTAPLPPREFNDQLSKAEQHPPAPVKIAFSVPKKKVRKAVDRNRIKRLMREAWRLQKYRIPTGLEDESQLPLGIIVLFIGREIPEYSAIFKAINRYIDQL